MHPNELATAPRTVGIIMDGNGRWAEARGLPRKEGHTRGMVNLIEIASAALDMGAHNVICYSLSAENLKREKEELSHILGLVLRYAEAFVGAFREKEACVKFLGRLDLLPEEIRASLTATEAALAPFAASGRTVYIAIAYGGRQEIADAVNEAVRKGEPVTADGFLRDLSLPEDVDLVVRTGGERRLSNFLLYQSAYAELYFSDRFFPDFSSQDLEEAFAWYASRKRRYGLV
jgi:undecaprenyl diphosphate synthase